MDLLLYSAIQDYIYARIGYFTEEVLLNNLTLALTIILSLLTLWVMIQGYLIATGRSQEGLKGFVYSLGKSYFIIAIALGVAAGGSFGVSTLTETLSDGISRIMTGNSGSGSECLLKNAPTILGCKIDEKLKGTQTMLATLNAVDTADDDYLEEKVTQAKWFAGIGTAGPAIVAGTMLIIFRIAMALFIGFAPIFILCLLFKKTAPLFQKWLFYGLATIFSGVMLGVMAEIAMDLVGILTSSSAATNFVSMVFTGKSAEGIMQTVTQQLGLGLILSTLLITVPPMAGLWFNGVMGNYSGYGVFDRSGIVPPGVDGGRSHQQTMVEDKVNHQYKQMGQTYEANQTANTFTNPFISKGMTNSVTQPEAIKQNSQLGNAVSSTVNAATQFARQGISTDDNSKTQKGEKL
ncbi:type IV secretion system protein [Neisseria sp. CCUG12390]|uniref:type IV secretion system protein n=1 Tax=Neisseria sp. CCUG12390 TaxID=3392035 RepID=UPI003A0FE2B5